MASTACYRDSFTFYLYLPSKNVKIKIYKTINLSVVLRSLTTGTKGRTQTEES
jgi:hypothetical protein